ncbi:purine-cytosine permease family protein [Komagataeibacter oboediens]|uniref:purine-cytosine permease family protein n=1 Tax=Komagataeibacter oboediens TaxID=65958 RepID=UPI0019045A34|nr:cytosine permease [Komagataeibacter oboediens]GCE78772.1 cytosine/purines/uracil/thiamine/allantoin transporter [Komagataeibacter oboediens]
MAKIEGAGPETVERPVPPELQTMSADRIFWSHFSPNLAPAAWVIGVLVVSLGLGGWSAFVVLLIGNVLGALPVAACAVMGPDTGLPQMEASRFSFGSRGKRLPALINWVNCIGWDAVNNVPSAIALILLVQTWGMTLPFWLAMAILALAQLLASAAGHDTVQTIEKYLGWILLAAFAFSGWMAVTHRPDGTPMVAAHPAPDGAHILLALGAVSSFTLAWTAYASDYTRYVSRRTGRGKVFALTFGGIFSSAMLMELFGLLTGAMIASPSPESVILALQSWMGPLAPVALAAIALSSIAINAANDNTAAYALISDGSRLPRPLSAVLTAGLAYVLAVMGEGRFTTLYENALLMALYWIAPWCGIVLTDWYARPPALKARRMVTPPGWSPSAILFVAVTVATIILFSSTPLYISPVARLLQGADIGYFVGFAMAATGQYLLLRQQARKYRLTGIKVTQA